MEKIIIDANSAAAGRLASFAAKHALQGREIAIVNSEKAIISGNKKDIIDKYLKLKKLGGTARKGPFYSRVPYMMLKRAIRGMLPDFRRGIGKQALSRIKCYDGIPKNFQNEKIIKFSSKRYDKYIEIDELSKRI